jgi:hypothetical protein
LEEKNITNYLNGCSWFTVTSRGELPPILELKKRGLAKDKHVFPWIVSMKNLYKLDFSEKEEEKFLLVIEKTAKRLYRMPEKDKLISIDEFTTGSSLLYRLILLYNIKKLEHQLGTKILPRFEFINLASPFYYGEGIDDSLIRRTLRIRRDNKKKMEKLLKFLNEEEEIVKIKIIELPQPVIWQDNEEVYGGIRITYLPYPLINSEYIKAFSRNDKKTQYELHKEIIEIHRNLTKDFLQKVSNSKIFGCNGLYILSKQELEKSEIKNLDKFIREYTKSSQSKVKDLLKQKIGLKNLSLEGLGVYKVKKSKKKESRRLLAKWSDLSLENQRETKEEELIRSGLRLILSIK